MSNDAASQSTSAIASSVERVLPGVLRWSVFSPAHKVDLCSHAVRMPSARGTGLVFDPISLSAEIWDWFPPSGPPDALVLTNDNHERDTVVWRALFPVPVWASPESRIDLPGANRWASGDSPASPFPGWNLIPLPGGAPGETAWHCPALSLVVFGDAVVNLAGRTLELLPDKYCTNPAWLRQSLQFVDSIPFENALFAHGTPLIGCASRRIAGLL